MNVDKWLNKRHKKDIYTCLHFTRDVWLELTGQDITERLHGLLGADNARRLVRSHFRAFERLQAPCSPCLVYMRQMGRDPHMGVFVDGRLLHLNKHGAEYFPLEIAARGFTDFRYYK